MNSILVTGNNIKQLEKKSLEICSENKIENIDILINTKETFGSNKKTEVQSIGIEDVKILQKKLFLKPIKSKIKACIIHDAQFLTLEAQNALLKILEEPPINTLIILTADRSDSLIQTVLSRCKIIKINEPDYLSSADKEKFSKQLNDFLLLSIPERFVLAEKLAKNKNETLIWLEQIILILRDKLLTNVTKKDNIRELNYAYNIKEFQKAYQLLKHSNINQRLALENLFLKIKLHKE